MLVDFDGNIKTLLTTQIKSDIILTSKLKQQLEGK